VLLLSSSAATVTNAQGVHPTPQPHRTLSLAAATHPTTCHSLLAAPTNHTACARAAAICKLLLVLLMLLQAVAAAAAAAAASSVQCLLAQVGGDLHAAAHNQNRVDISSNMTWQHV
jgi:hypothetical protein